MWDGSLREGLIPSSMLYWLLVVDDQTINLPWRSWWQWITDLDTIRDLCSVGWFHGTTYRSYSQFTSWKRWACLVSHRSYYNVFNSLMCWFDRCSHSGEVLETSEMLEIATAVRHANFLSSLMIQMSCNQWQFCAKMAPLVKESLWPH